MTLPRLPSRFPPRSPRFLGAVALANVGGVIAYLPLLTLLLPIKVEGLSGEARIGVFTATVVAGAVAASLSNVLFGWLSDRSVAQGGGRRGWVAGGVVATAISYAGIATAATPTTLVLAIVGFQAGVNALLAPLMAIMAEEVPDAQKGWQVVCSPSAIRWRRDFRPFWSDRRCCRKRHGSRSCLRRWPLA